MERANVRLIVEIQPGEQVSGSAGREGEDPVPFEGMLGFLSLFERLRQRRDDEWPGADAGASLDPPPPAPPPAPCES